jgi:hypothetical protein
MGWFASWMNDDDGKALSHVPDSSPNGREVSVGSDPGHGGWVLDSSIHASLALMSPF